METSAPSMDHIKAAMRAAWSAGDFGVVAKTLSKTAEEFVEHLRVPDGSGVLDVACGSGNVAIPLARQGYVVTGLDLTPSLLEQARARALAEGLNMRLDEGDAEQMAYADGSFDAVVSMFGAMFAPRPEVVAAEMARVLRPGGMLGMANWNPDGFTGRMFKVNSRHVPPPPGVQPPVLWGDEEMVHKRLSADFENIKTELIPVDFDLPVSPAGAVTFFRTYYGPTNVAFNRLDDAGQAALANDLEALWSAANEAGNPEEHTLVHNTYLEVRATRKE